MIYEIWAEGYIATGNSSGATKLGEAEGKDFEEAVTNLFKDRGDAHYLNSDKTHYWGCELFDNCSDARRRFG